MKCEVYPECGPIDEGGRTQRRRGRKKEGDVVQVTPNDSISVGSERFSTPLIALNLCFD